MTDEPEEPSGDADAPGPAGSRGFGAFGDRSGLVAGEAAAIARFGGGPALFSPDVPAPRHPHVGPLLPGRRVGAHPAPAPVPAGGPARPSAELVRVRRDLPARRTDAVGTAWTRAGSAARRGVEVAVDWTARGVVTAVDAVGAAAQAVVALVRSALVSTNPPYSTD